MQLAAESRSLNSVMTSSKTSPESIDTPKARVGSLDAYRGFVMFLMLAEVLSVCAVSREVPSSATWDFLCQQQTHRAWTGSSLHDLIQPSFYFLVGAALVVSLQRRLSSGQRAGALVRHAFARSVILIVVGMCMVAVHPRHWVWDFNDTLTQIGLAYPFLFLIATRPGRVWFISLGAILAGYWFWFVAYPVPAPEFDYTAVGVSSEWVQIHGLTGFAAHWQKNSNVSSEFDRWFINLFPGTENYPGHALGLTTLNFVPSLGTMILGLFAGMQLRAARPPWRNVRLFAFTGTLLILAGWLLDRLHICPVVKAVWTPSWVLFSGGWCFLILSAFHALVDVLGFRRAVFPLTVIGMNSMLAYVISHVYPALAYNSLRRVLGDWPFELLGAAYEPIVYGAAVLCFYWLVLFVLYSRRIVLRI